MGGLVEREGARLAGRADDAAGGAGEAGEVLALAAGRAGGELWGEARGEQQLEAEGERVGAAGAGGLAVEQRELAYDDYQGARGARGGRQDRNVILPTERPAP